MRSSLYKLARWMGDMNALAKSKVGKRAVSRMTGKAAGRGLRKLNEPTKKRRR